MKEKQSVLDFLVIQMQAFCCIKCHQMDMMMGMLCSKMTFKPI
ncbi:hypothetical protein [Myroides injenensis]|nr:hypothetical protein [Myroides injenensis]